MTGGLLQLLLDASWPLPTASRPMGACKPLDLTVGGISSELGAGWVLLQVQERASERVGALGLGLLPVKECLQRFALLSKVVAHAHIA